MLKQARHLTFAWTILIQPTPSHTLFVRLILISQSYKRLVLPWGPFLQVSPSKPYMQFSTIRAKCPAHLTLFNLITLIVFCVDRKLWSSSLCDFSTIACLYRCYVQISSLAGYSQTLSLCSSHNARGQVSIPYKGDKIITFWTSIFTLLDSKWKDKRFWAE